ncbi:MAG TPA: hypothetical protein VGX23_08915 [Actinocrinis sp.]|nr:hypothetical protein [Actinocrinis sp.]
MSGSSLPAWVLLVGTVLVFGTARLASGSERSLAAIGSLMGLDQTVLHFAFAAAQQHAAMVGAMPAMPGMPLSAMPVPGMAMPGMSSVTAVRMTPGMLLAHALAALLCTWWLRCGEAMAHSLVRAVATWFAEGPHIAVLGGRPVAPRPPVGGAWNAPAVPTGGLLHFAVTRRGPPRA